MHHVHSRGGLAVLPLAVLLAACSGAPASSAPAGSSGSTSSAPATSAPAGSAATPSAAIDTAPVVMAWQSTPDENYLPILMAIDAMKNEGYHITATQLADTNVVFQGLQSNTVQFTADSLQAGSQGAQAGIPVKIITTRNANQVVYAANKADQDCKNLDGKAVGIYSPDAAYTILMNLYFNAHCPGIKTTSVTIQDSPLRAQALAQGQIFATTLGLPDAMTLDAQDPGKLFMVSLATELPGVGDEYLYANEKTIQDHPSIVEALVREHLKAIRSLYENPSSATAAVTKFLPDVKTDAVAQRFISDKLWYANGGLTGPGLENTLQAFSLPGDRASLVDDTALKAALQEIGPSSQTKY